MTAQAVLVSVNNIGIRLMLLFVVLALVLPGHQLTSQAIFPSIALYQILRASFFSRISMAMQFAGQGYTTVNRIKVGGNSACMSVFTP